MTFTIARRLEFDYGHRILGHEGKCVKLHGHRGVAEVSVESTQLDNIDRVVDYAVIKEKVGGFIDENWDHNMLLHKDDPLLCCIGNKKTIVLATLDDPFSGLNAEGVVGDQNFYVMKHGNPTAENMARELFEVAQSLLGSSNLKVVNVRIYETTNCYADYNEDNNAHT